MNWTLFDYGVGNLHSLRKAVERGGRQVTVTADPQDLADADAILLPGVGAFGAVMDSLEPAREAIWEHHNDGRPILGICIGMQVLYAGSDEDPEHEGLGLIPAQVRRLPGPKVPHMGWNTLDVVGEVMPEELPLQAALAKAGHVYYVHSYAAPVTSQAIAATTYGMDFAAAVTADATIGFQFHPEKSSQAGAGILAAALDILEDA